MATVGNGVRYFDPGRGSPLISLLHTLVHAAKAVINRASSASLDHRSGGKLPNGLCPNVVPCAHPRSTFLSQAWDLAEAATALERFGCGRRCRRIASALFPPCYESAKFLHPVRLECQLPPCERLGQCSRTA